MVTTSDEHKQRARAGPHVEPASSQALRRRLSELGSTEQGRVAEFGAIVVAGFLAAVVLLYAFAWLANEVLDHETQSLDLATRTFLQRFSSPDLTLAAEVVSAMGSQVVFALGGFLVVLFIWQRRWGAALTLLLVTGGAQVLNDVLKELVHRTRPSQVIGLIDAQQFSFPSGHAMVAAAFYLYLAYLSWRLVRGWWRGLLVVGLIVLVLLIGLSRLYLEAHYLSDVIAGYLAGLLWTDAVIIGGRVLSTRTHRRRIVRKVG
jgi:undecaprenyl-diphosphatase